MKYVPCHNIVPSDQKTVLLGCTSITPMIYNREGLTPTVLVLLYHMKTGVRALLCKLFALVSKSELQLLIFFVIDLKALTIFPFFLCRVDLLPYDLITQLFRILSVAYDSRGNVLSYLFLQFLIMN